MDPAVVASCGFPLGFILVAVSLVLSPNLYPKRRRRPSWDEHAVPSGTLLLGHAEKDPLTSLCPGSELVRQLPEDRGSLGTEASCLPRSCPLTSPAGSADQN